MKALARSALLSVIVVSLAACSGVRWVTISGVSAENSSATSLAIVIDACTEVPGPRLVESDTEVHLLIDKKFDYGGDQKMCLGGAVVQLAHPIGARTVIDDRDHRVLSVTWTPVTPPVHLVGNVSQLLGLEGDATVTAWLVVDESGVALLCDDLPATATTCPSEAMVVDWSAGAAKPPTGLVKRGTAMVSAGPVTLRGSLKVDILYVGVVP